MPAIKPKYEYSVICDDVREEIGNKVTFVGVYGPDIFVSQIPFSFPKLCFVNFCKDVKKGDSISIDIIDPSGKKLSKTINSIAPKDGMGHAKKIAIFAIYSPLAVEQEGLHKLILVFNKDNKNKKEVEFTIRLPDKMP